MQQGREHVQPIPTVKRLTGFEAVKYPVTWGHSGIVNAGESTATTQRTTNTIEFSLLSADLTYMATGIQSEKELYLHRLFREMCYLLHFIKRILRQRPLPTIHTTWHETPQLTWWPLSYVQGQSELKDSRTRAFNLTIAHRPTKSIRRQPFSSEERNSGLSFSPNIALGAPAPLWFFFLIFIQHV